MPKTKLAGAQALVTGGAGFIGSNLVDALLEEGCRVRVFDNLETGSLDNLDHSIEAIDWLEGDLRDPEACQKACRDVDVVFHQAALGSVPRSMADPARSLDVNLGGTANIFAAARDNGTRRVVYASSSSVYGDSPDLPKREGGEGRPLSPYAASKCFCEQIANVFVRCYEIQLVGLRYFNVYGPRQSPDGPYAAAIPRFFQAGLQGTPVPIHGDGEQTRDFTFVADAVAANLHAAEAPERASGKAYNVAGGRRVGINEMVAAIGGVLGKELAVEHGPERPGDVRHSLADLSNATADLGYEASVDIESGLSQCRNYYEKLFAQRD